MEIEQTGGKTVQEDEGGDFGSEDGKLKEQRDDGEHDRNTRTGTQRERQHLERRGSRG